MAIQISQFRRPGVYIQEIDQSIQTTPIQDTIINLVSGFSKKGPQNRPVLVSSPAEFTSVFGTVDRSMEKNGCFFHRTVNNILNQAPVWALSLLHTDDDLDKLEWKAIATAADNLNSPIYEDPYSNFFNRNEFWIRDTEAFLNIADKRQPTDISKILNFTNMGDTPISVFIFKSDITGFDVKAEDWYGGPDKVPTWMYTDDLMSDYMVTVLVVGGDWSNYQVLATDPRWGTYFNTHGLIKDEYRNFINDPSVTLLNRYDVSLIPFFRDQNGTNFYIETVINRDTDRTGLFVAYDVDALETEYPNGLIDMLGWTLVGQDKDMVDYVSYKEVITETVKFEQSAIVSAGNTFIDPSKEVNYQGDLLNGMYETKWIMTPTFSVTPSDANDPSTNKVSRIELSNTARLILNDIDLSIPQAQILSIPDVSPGRIRKDTIYTDSLGQLGVQTGIEVSEFTDWDVVPTVALSNVLYPIAVVEVGTHNDGTVTQPYLGVPNDDAVDVLEDLKWGISQASTSAMGDVNIEVYYENSFTVRVIFHNTKSSDEDINYDKSRSLQVFNNLRENVLVGSSVLVTTSDKANILEVGYITDSNSNKEAKFTISTNLVIASPLELYYSDDALEFGEIGMRSVANPPDYGIVSPNSTFYTQFYDGTIKSGDYFYQNIVENGDGVNAIEFFRDDLGQPIINIYTRDNAPEGEVDGALANNIEISGGGGDMVYIQGSEKNDKTFTILSSTYEPVSVTLQGVTYQHLQILIVNESIIDESIYNQLTTLHDGNPDQIVYLKMYSIQQDLYVDFVNTPQLEVAGEQRINPVNNPEIWVFSDRSNYSQTVEIEAVLENNAFLIDANRYGEVIVGDFLQATVPADLPIGYVPKMFTRIISRKIWPADPSLAEIATDAAVAYFDADPTTNSDIQVIRYTAIEAYVNTYQAIVLNGFQIRQDSMPNGTETRQNDILNILAPGTPVFKGLTNRNQLSWRYFVDPWGLGLTNNSKQQIVDLCGARLNCLGLLNMPSARSFKESTNPTFTNDDGTINYEYVRLGGDPESNPAFRYTLGEGQGQTNVAYFYPYASLNDNGRPINVPMAMFVANTFMNKFNSRRSDMYPWTIAAGVINGLVVGFGATEVDLIGDDIEELNEMGTNPVVFKLNRGYNIETNNTAQAVPKTALSNIHVREVLIELENEMYNMLINYQWRFNTAEVRAEIKQRADAICARFVAQNGLFDYFNVMDETNNTAEIIDAGIGVIDTYVEPVKGMGIIVNNITILSTGTIQSGGFITQ